MTSPASQSKNGEGKKKNQHEFGKYIAWQRECGGIDLSYHTSPFLLSKGAAIDWGCVHSEDGGGGAGGAASEKIWVYEESSATNTSGHSFKIQDE